MSCMAHALLYQAERERREAANGTQRSPGVQEKPLPWKKLIFSLAFFHAVIQERRKFGPIGWNIRYDFNQSDFECSMSTVRMFLLDNEAVPWDAMEFVVGQINYGGRVTDDNDRRCLMAILRQYILPGVLDPAYTFTPSGRYFSPAGAETPLEAVREYVRELPAADAPEVFGMHPNASIQSQLQETSSLVQTIVSIQPRVAGGGSGESPEEFIFSLADRLLEQIPEVRLVRGAPSGVRRSATALRHGGAGWWGPL